MKKIVVVSSTPRKGGNSEILAQQFAEGAKAAGHEVAFVSVRELGLKFCIGCMSCQKTYTEKPWRERETERDRKRERLRDIERHRDRQRDRDRESL